MTNIARLNYASAGAVRRRDPEPDPRAEAERLASDMIALSHKFATQAEVLETAFVRNTDKYAVRRGAFCADAVNCRYIATQLRELARQID